MTGFTTGTVTFLFTDIEGSTQLWEQYPETARAALTRHDQIIEELVVKHLGIVVRPRGEGDSRFAVFPRATDAVIAAAAIQGALNAEPWTTPVPLKVRMALHTGEADLRDGDYYGTAVNRCARLRSAAHGGQTLVSQATYDLVRDTLPADLDLSFRDLGERRLKDLERPEHIFQLSTPGLPADFPPLNTLDSRPHNLPIQRTPIVGREKEVAAASALLLRNDIGLLTLTGPGGTGKTRLGLQIAAELADQFEGGAFMVPLAPVDDPALVVSTIVRTLELPEVSGRSEIDNLKDYLRPKRMLLFLDNFEQVQAAAPIVGELLSAAPHLKVLVTTREALRIYGEHEFPVPPLDLPDPTGGRLTAQQLTQYEAVRLFIERAKAIKPDFTVTDDNAPAVAEICFRLDGLPLAIELAAARIRLLPPQAMLARLQGKLQGRLQLLTGGARDLPARQQTLRGAIEWSYDLLMDDERKLFNRLSIFRGGCTLEAAEAICAGDDEGRRTKDESKITIVPLDLDLFEGIESLVTKSLVRQTESSTGEPRFWMLETIREYGFEQLELSGEADMLRRKHAEYYVALAEDAERGYATPQVVEWLDRIEAEHANFDAILEWALEPTATGLSSGPSETQILGLRATGTLWRFWHIRGFTNEGNHWAEDMVKAAGPPEGTLLWVRALQAVNLMKWGRGLISEARPYADQLIAMARKLGNAVYIGWGQTALGAQIAMSGNYQDKIEFVRDCLQEGVALSRTAGDVWPAAFAIMGAGLAENAMGNFDAGRMYCEESLVRYRRLGDIWGVSQAVNILGDLARIRGDYAEAQRLYEETLTIYRKLGIKSDIPASLHNLAYVALHMGDRERARALFKESMALQLDRGNPFGVIECLSGLASEALAGEQYERATRLAAAVDTLRTELNAAVWPAEQAENERSLAQLRAALDDAAWQAAWAAGQNMSLDQAVQYALEEI